VEGIPLADTLEIRLDDVVVRLRDPHDFSFLRKHGQVFRVFDENDSGNISFGVVQGDRKLFVKYAGARTINFQGEPCQAIARLKAAMPVYEALRHPVLIDLAEHYETESGYAAVFAWVEGECLHAHWDFDNKPKYTHPQSPSYRVRRLPIAAKLALLAGVFSLHEFAASKGYVAIDFYDGSLIYDFETGRVTVCDVDCYQKAPVVNTMGRMWGSSRFQAPEEYELGASIDGITNVFALGALAFELFGNNRDRCLAKWEGSRALYDVAMRAVAPERDERYQSIPEFIGAWDAAALV
jgi:serine/threonine protein kinase, bacterial